MFEFTYRVVGGELTQHAVPETVNAAVANVHPKDVAVTEEQTGKSGAHIEILGNLYSLLLYEVMRVADPRLQHVSHHAGIGRVGDCLYQGLEALSRKLACELTTGMASHSVGNNGCHLGFPVESQCGTKIIIAIELAVEQYHIFVVGSFQSNI